jgi:hypothetical protein
MELTKGHLLKQLTGLPAGAAVTTRELGKLGISPQRAYGYVQRGWLQKIGRGVFVRPGAPLDLRSALRALESAGFSAHVGGKTALEWRGVRHFVSTRHATLLYGTDDQRLPAWITTHFDITYRRKMLFRGKGVGPLGISRVDDSPASPLTSENERAALEMLSEIPQRHSLEEARELMQALTTLRPELLNQLLRVCTNVKTVRLFLMLSRELELPYLRKLDLKKIPTGSKSRWVVKTKGTTLVLKP